MCNFVANVPLAFLSSLAIQWSEFNLLRWAILKNSNNISYLYCIRIHLYDSSMTNMKKMLVCQKYSSDGSWHKIHWRMMQLDKKIFSFLTYPTFLILYLIILYSSAVFFLLGWRLTYISLKWLGNWNYLLY